MAGSGRLRGEEADAQESRRVEERIAAELSRMTGPPQQAGPPSPYVRRHAVEHAAAGGVLDGRYISWDFLPYADASRLRAVAPRRGAAPTQGDEAWRALLRVWRKAAHVWTWNSPQSNAETLLLYAACAGLDIPPDAAARSSWRPRWASWPLDDGEILGRHSGTVEAMDTATLPDGTPVAVTSCDDGTLSVWNLAAGRRIAERGSFPVRALAALLRPDNTLAVVTGGDSAPAVHTWDPASTEWIGAAVPAAHSDPPGPVVQAVCTALLPDGTPLVVTGDDTARTRVWELGAELTPRGGPLIGHAGAVRAVATAVLPDGTPVVVTGSRDRTVRVWDLATGRPVLPPLTHTGAVHAVATAVLPDGTPVAVTGGDDGTVRSWELASGRRRTLHATGTNRSIRTVATLQSKEAVLAVTGSDDGSVRLWDLTADEPAGRPLLGHTRLVQASAIATLADGIPVAVTGGRDRTVRMWDLTPRPQPAEPDAHRPLRLTAVAAVTGRDGTRFAVTGGGDGVVRLWDLATGRPTGAPQDARKGAVRTIATARLPDGGPLVVSSGDDGSVQVWDPLRDTTRRALAGGGVGAPPIATTVLPDGTPVAVTCEEKTRLWDLAAERRLRMRSVPRPRAVTVAVGPDGSLHAALVDSSGFLQLCHLSAEDAVVEPPSGPVTRVDVLATTVLGDGSPAVVTGGRDGSVRMWSMLTGEPAGGPLRGHEQRVDALATAVLPDGTPVAVSGGRDRTVRLWNLATGRPALSPLTVPGEIAALAADVAGGELLVLIAGRGLAVTAVRLDGLQS